MTVLMEINSTIQQPCCDTPCCAPYRTKSVGAAVRGSTARSTNTSGHASVWAATVCGMDLRADPERVRVAVFEQPASMTYAVALVLESVTLEAGYAEALRRAEELRARLGLVGPEWVRREEAARLLGVGVKMVDKLRRSGRLRGLRVARTNRAYVHRSDVDALARKRAGRTS